MNQNWLAVACASHVQIGVEGGFMQVCHGKLAPLKRIQADDYIIYYSPTLHFKGIEKLQAFTAIGIVLPGEPYQVDMGNGFQPFRRNVLWGKGVDVSIHTLIESLELTKNTKNWGYPFRFGLLKISEADKRIIANAMQAYIH
ncbi:EVE domain-containing protein [Fluoribacter dumoffii]|uniref:EVE domain-containing protein n=1 Tax=Fluoribacter dumoffii TaxID=463 RepID=UPI0022448FB9|nr:EVE domain-containing protein [Fluoribacter dumoffii]MCW8387796.1 EVE domain-containing protein [Fluoribacter dumoffii]HCX3367495.1 EVE domain-containing protein [Legionella pneumophila]